MRFCAIYCKLSILLISALCALQGCRSNEINIVEDESLLALSKSVEMGVSEHFAIFSGPSREEYVVSGTTSDGKLKLSRLKEKSERSGTYSRYYGIYPYSELCSSQSEGKINVSLPVSRNWSNGATEGRQLCAMTSSLQDKTLEFKDFCGILDVRIKGDVAISRITLCGMNDEVLSGVGVLSFASDSSSRLEMSSVGGKETVITSSTPVELAAYPLGADFLIPIPEGEYEKGFKVVVRASTEMDYEYEFTDAASILPGKTHTLTIDDMYHSEGHSLLSFGVTLPDGKWCDALDVSGDNVVLCVPRGTDVTALKPVFKHNGADVLVGGKSQKSGKSTVDFTNAVTYSVVSEEGETSTYNIKVLDIDIPAIIVCTPAHKAIVDRENWIDSSRFVVLDPSDWSYTDYGSTGIRGRGNSSWSYAKKPYAIKFAVRPQKQTPAKETLLGMPGHKRWCLLSNCMGYHMTNQLGYEVGRRSTFQWSPHARYVELILNGVHKGLYSLVEQIRIDKYRLDIKEMDAEDVTEKKITGGYLLNFDNTFDETWQFKSSLYTMPIMIKSPDDDVMVQAQFDYIKNYINTMEASLKSDSLFAKRDYLKYLDPDTFIGAWMTKELAGRKSKATGTSTDFITPRSVFYYKDRGDVLKAGPGWDFDVHFLLHTEVLNCTKCQYYGRLFQDPSFVQRVKELWPDFKSNLQGNSKFPTSITAYVDSLYNVCAYSAARDEVMWKSIWKSYPWYDAASQRDRHKQALTDRISFMEKKINELN